MTHLLRAACAVVLLLPSGARAQTPPSVSLQDPDPPRWEAAGHAGGVSVDKVETAAEWNRWYHAAAAGGSAAWFVTPHVRIDLDGATSAAGAVYSEERFTVPGQPFPSVRLREHRFRTTTVGAGLSYQFFDNRWVHPLIGTGVELVRETARASTSGAGPGVPSPPRPDDTAATSWRARPYLGFGVKWFVSERAFIRTDVRTSFDRGGAALAYRAGVGVEL